MNQSWLSWRSSADEGQSHHPQAGFLSTSYCIYADHDLAGVSSGRVSTRADIYRVEADDKAITVEVKRVVDGQQRKLMEEMSRVPAEYSKKTYCMLSVANKHAIAKTKTRAVITMGVV